MRRLLAAVSAFALLLALAGCRIITDDGTTVTVPNCALPTVAPTAVTSGTCTWTASPAPTSTTTAASTTTSTVPPTTSTTTVTPPAGGFPTPATVGVPAGAKLTQHTGDLTVTTAGATITGQHITGDLIVRAPGVTVTASQIDGEIDNEYAAHDQARMVVTDTTVGTSTCVDSPGVGEHDFTAERVLVHGHGDGFRMSGNHVSILDSVAITCDYGVNHADALQVYCPPKDLPQPCSDLDVEHNTLDVSHSPKTENAPLWGGGPAGGGNGELANATFRNNLLAGGVYTVYLIWSQGPNFVITGNRVVNKSWVYGSSSLEGTCAHVTWQDNRSVTIDTAYRVTSDVGALACLN